jgi:Carboxypeptidase regulatory-like domain/TonB dependent receptor-like, beta-barrel
MRSPRRRELLFAVAVSSLLAAPEVAAQTNNATVQGTVTDSAGAVVAGAMITVQSVDTGLVRTVTTSPAGNYVVNFLPAGTYSITAALTGFKTIRRTEMRLQVAQVRTEDFKLEVGALEEAVTVVETAPPLDRNSPSISTVIGETQLKELPLNGRHWAALMMLAPGAINTGAGSHTTIRFLGRSVDDNNWTFDGVDATGVKDPKQESVARLIISMDSISEFRVSAAQYSAEVGSAGGGQVQLLSKSGTNRYRGSVYDFLRNNRFDAPAFGDTTTPPFKLNQFGANLGGPIVKDRTFFFANYEGLRERLTENITNFVPSAAFRSTVAPALAAVAAAYPAGTAPTSDRNIDEWRAARKTTKDENAFMVRLDHRFSNRTVAFVRYNQDIATIESPTGAGVRNDHFKPQNLVAEVNHIFSSNVVNQFKLGYNHARLDRVEAGPFYETITVPGFATLTGNSQLLENGKSYSLIDNLAVVKGRHNVKFGFEVRRIKIPVGDGGTNTQAFASRPDFAANRLQSFQIIDFGVAEGQRWYYFGYMQDDFKLRPNLTLNLGARYEYYSVVKEKDGIAKVFSIECGGICPPGTPLYDSDKNNIAPRLGFAWSPSRFKEKTVIRGGFGMFYGPGQNDDVFAGIDNVEERVGLDRTQAPNLTYPITPFLGLAGVSGKTPRALEIHRQDLYTEQYSLSVQQQLPWDFLMQVGYVGNQGHHLFGRSFLNTIDPATGKRPLATFGQIDEKVNEGNSTFHGLQVSLHRQFRGGFLFGGQYMWSHSINDGSVGGGDGDPPQNLNDLRGNRGNSREDIRHTGTLNWVWQLPVGKGHRYMNRGGLGDLVLGGWELSGLAQARTGRQLTVTLSRARGDLPDGNSGTGGTNGSAQRPDLIPGVPLKPPQGQSPDLWINAAAFATPAKGTWGNAGRSLLTGPGLFQVDVGLQKQFAIAGERNIAFRWEIFNVLNRDNLANPETNLSAGPAFGRITSSLTRGAGTGSPRQMQFMLRLNF